MMLDEVADPLDREVGGRVAGDVDDVERVVPLPRPNRRDATSPDLLDGGRIRTLSSTST